MNSQNKVSLFSGGVLGAKTGLIASLLFSPAPIFVLVPRGVSSNIGEFLWTYLQISPFLLSLGILPGIVVGSLTGLVVVKTISMLQKTLIGNPLQAGFAGGLIAAGVIIAIETVFPRIRYLLGNESVWLVLVPYVIYFLCSIWMGRFIYNRIFMTD